MKITNRQRDGVTILDLAGKLTIGAGDIALRNAVNDALNAGHTQILLNLASVSTIDSSGVGELVGCYTATSSRGGELKLYNLPMKVQDVLTITQLITVFEVFDTEEEALESFS